ncbi:MAG: diguanylate cyclase (GGDEF)-like protein/PAS domain S-box-containing protein [Kiritimatiellia bacterium]|jgi:diguanylate cyclase (GGDEF)-like protein/PAS domain S-box-containing protein
MAVIPKLIFAKNFTLTKIIVSGFLVIITFVSVLFFAGFWGVYQHNNNLRDAALARGFKVAIVSDMLSTTYHRSQSTLLLYGRGYKDFSLFDEDYQKGTLDFNNAIKGLGQLKSSAEQKKIIEQAVQKSKEVDKVQSYLYNYFSLYEDESPVPDISADEVAAMYESLDQSIRNLLEYEQVGWFREVSNSIDYSEGLYKTGFFLFLLTFLVSGAIAFNVMRLAGFAESRLRKQKEYAQTTLISIADGVIAVNANGVIEQINKTAQELTGWAEIDAVGQHLSSVYVAYSLKTDLCIEHPAGNPREDDTRKFHALHVMKSKDGKAHEVDSSYSIVKHDEKIGGAVLIFRDISGAQEMSRQLKWQASHDSLTGLINRNSFEGKINEAIQSAASDGVEYALLFIDLDQFKVVNDTCGHVAGDELLSQVGLIFEKCIRKTDVLARLGGDEFGILLFGCEEELAYSISEKLLKAISEFRFVWEDKVFSVGASIGFVVIDDGGTDSAEFMSAADMACYAAKEGGRGRVKKYDKEISANAEEMTMSARITQALDDDSFLLYFQTILPLNPLDDSENVCEILVRMESQGKVLLPNSFLPAAERYNLMCNIDRWVIDNILDAISIALKTNADDIYDQYCINLSGASINDEGFFDFVRGKIEEYAVPTQYLCFEITETVAITNLAKAASLIGQIKDLGCRLSLDDFGTGASSFAYLKYLTVDHVKIDGTFIKDLIDDPVDLEIVDAIVRIAKVLGVKTVAEFVETEELLDKVKELGIDYAQGYVISRPEPLLLCPLLSSKDGSY